MSENLENKDMENENSKSSDVTDIPALDEAYTDIAENSAADDIEDDFGDTTIVRTENLNTTQDNPSSELEQVNENNRRAFNDFAKKITKPLLVVGLLLFAVCLGLYIAGIATLPQNTVMKNVYVEDVYVGGMTYDEVLKAMEQTFLLENQKIIVTSNGQKFTINGNDIGMAANPVDTAKKVYNYGKSGNVITDGFKNALRLVKKHIVIPVAHIDEQLLSSKINEFGIQIFGEMIGHYVEINEIDTTATIWPGHTGYNPNDSKSYEEATKIVLNSISKDNYNNIFIPLKACAPPDISMQTFDGLVYTDPTDAYYKVENNTVEVVPETTGRYINKEEAAPLLPLVKEGGEVIKIPYYVSYANITGQMLSDKLFANTLASYSTNYGGSTANRAANVARAAELINGKILAPDEIFSFNDTVGPRTASNGFYTATEYVDGKSVQGIGGGTCQVSTTLYSAVLYADLQIVHRENHVMTVGYVPLGQDATVAYGSVDFKFKNTTGYPVKIVTSTGGGTITVSIVGTDWEPKRTVELNHSTSYIGEDTSVKSTRYVYENGNLISTDPLGTSYYKPHKEEEPESTSNSGSLSSASSSSVQSESSSDTSNLEDTVSADTSSDISYDTSDGE